MDLQNYVFPGQYWRGQEKVTKEKATPMQRSPGILPCDSAQRLRGWLTVHPWTGSQLARIPASHPRIESGAGSAGLLSAAAPLHGGPGHCASCAAKTKQIPANLRMLLRFCSWSSFSRPAGEGANGGWGRFGFCLCFSLWRAGCAL